MKKLLLSILSIALFLNCTYAQTLKVDFETRGGFMIDDDPHFYADYLNLIVRSDIAQGFSFTWKQRFTKPLVGTQPLNATDYVFLNYNVDKWTFSAGKQVLECGGFEYDASPIDIHFSTDFYYAIPCYQLGISATRTFGTRRLIAQFCRSPYATFESDQMNALKAFNIAWRGTYGLGGWLPMYSLNLFEVTPGSYSLQFTLGNRVEITKSLAVELDFINRSEPGSVNLFQDMSAVAYVAIVPVEWCEIMIKGTYDRNILWDNPLLQKGLKEWKLGVGAYFFPLKEHKNVRLHCYFWHDGYGNCLQTGLTWKPNLLNLDFSKKNN